MSVDTQPYAPSIIPQEEIDRLLYVFRNDKATKILHLLLDNDSLYLNEIHNKIGGSKTTTMQVLAALERKKLIQSEWKMIQMSTDQQRAVKGFHLNQTERNLVDSYSRFLTNF